MRTWVVWGVAFSLVLLGADAGAAGLRRDVAKALGGRTMSGYQPVRGASLLLRPPWKGRAAQAAPLPEGPALTTRSRHGQVSYLDAGHYEDVRDVALRLLKKYRPERHFYVAVGRSPGALAAFLQILNPHMVMTFPASGLRQGVQAGWKPAFFEHFEQLIPDDVLAGERTIVLFDRSRGGSGTSLAQLKAFLEEHLAARNGKPVRVKAVGIAPKGPLQGGVELFSSARHPNVFKYLGPGKDHDEDFAPFRSKHRIGTQAITAIRANPNYARMRDALERRMAHDDKLKKALRKHFADHLDEGER